MKTHALQKILVQTAFLFVTVSSLTTAVVSQSAINPGDLDTTFGDGGIALAYSSGYQFNFASAMATQPDGKIVVVGQGVGPSHGYNWESAVVRFNPDGSLDTSLGGTGIVINPVGFGFYSVAIQPDGKIVVVCSVAIGTFAVVRYNPNGSLDTSFNGSGTVLTPVTDYGGPSSVAIQTDGKIVVAGSNGNDSFAIVRYNPNGSLDTSFNGSGIVLTPVGGRATSVAIQADGKIIAVGGTSFSGNGFILVRYNSDGSLDTSFNGTGVVSTSFENSLRIAFDLAIQTDGKIVVVGYGVDPGAVIAVVRYNPDGSLDTSFGGTGKILIPDSGFASSVSIQPNGKIVVAGITFIDGDSVFAVGRLNPNGSLDTSFNGTGIVITPVGKRYNNSFYDEGGYVAIQADGKIVVAGESGPDEFKSFVVVRYQGDGPNPSCLSANPIDCPDFFVRQQYLDFLNRDPDTPGLAHWTSEITLCDDANNRYPDETEAQCIDRKRVNDSGAFFLSPEFQNTGSFAVRVYWGSLGQGRDACNIVVNGVTYPAICNPGYSQYLADMTQLTQGIVVNNALDPAKINQNKQAFVNQFVTRSEFLAANAYPAGMPADQYVDKLSQTTGIALTSQERSDLISNVNSPGSDETCNGFTSGRACALFKIVDGTTTIANGVLQFNNRYGQSYYDATFNPAFVFMQYLGYLRRNPDRDGFDFWLGKLIQYGNFTDAEMVRSFIVSEEYRRRFGQQ